MKVNYVIILLMAVLAASCGSAKKQVANQVVITENAPPTNYPQIEGFVSRTIAVPANGGREIGGTLKVELVPGKTMEVDCNRHRLAGQFEKVTTDEGDTYYIFKTDGSVISTRMACPDNTKRKAFVQGEGITIEYNSSSPALVYTPTDIEVKHRIWTAGQTYSIGKTVNISTDTEAIRALAAYPEAEEGYERYVLILPEVLTQNNDRRVEIIPGLTAKADCNRHILIGTLTEEVVDGWGYNYYMFESDGNYISTRMACPDDTVKSQFITGPTKTINYNSRLPLVIYAPEGKNLEIHYRIWESPTTGN